MLQFGNRVFPEGQYAILDRAKTEKRSLNAKDVQQMNKAIMKYHKEHNTRSVEPEEEKKDKQNQEPEDKEHDDSNVTPSEKETEEKEPDDVKPEDKSGDNNEEVHEEQREDSESEPENDSETKEDEEVSVPEKEDEEEESNENEDKTEKRSINTYTMKKEFSILNAINAIVNNRSLDEVASAVNEKGLVEMRKSGLNYSGQIHLPVQELRNVTVTTEHDNVVATDLYDILEPLYAKNVLVQAGAKFMSGLVGDVQVPCMSAGSVTWEGETAAAKESEYTFSSVKLSPKRLTAYVDISKQFIIQDSKGAEAMIRADIVKALNAKLEATILGDLAATSTQPGGIFADATLDTITSYQDICDLECKLEDANVFSDMKYIMSNKAKAALRAMAKSEHNEYVLEGNTVDGTPYLNTSHIVGKKVAYGDFSNLAIGQWGAIDIVVDPYTKAADGQIRIVINSYWDAKVLRPEAFAFATVGE